MRLLRARGAGDVPITVCVLETVSITRAGHPPVRIGSMQQKIMLTLLVAYDGRSVSVDRLAEELWGEDKPRRWLASIRTLANTLRRVADDRSFIHWTGRGYRLHQDLAMVRSDIDEMLSCADEARVAFDEGRLGDAEDAARRALACYGGGPWTTDCWYWGDLAADVYHLLGRVLLAEENYLRCVLDLSRAPEELDWHDGIRACLQKARDALAAV
ncbi:MAG: hypothetical protein M3326_04670 [Actinomycetota bacterium]|nr:hypothetical protein [Actinomycetota bacterium]